MTLKYVFLPLVACLALASFVVNTMPAPLEGPVALDAAATAQAMLDN